MDEKIYNLYILKIIYFFVHGLRHIAPPDSTVYDGLRRSTPSGPPGLCPKNLLAFRSFWSVGVTRWTCRPWLVAVRIVGLDFGAFFGVRLGHTLGLLVRPRVTSCDLIRPHSTSFDLVRPRSTSFDLIRPHSTSFDFIRPHSTSCDLVRPRATSCDLVRPRSTSFGVIRPHSTSRDLVRPRVTSCKLDHNFRHSARQLQVSVQAPRYQNERTGPDRWCDQNFRRQDGTSRFHFESPRTKMRGAEPEVWIPAFSGLLEMTVSPGHPGRP